MKRSAQNKIVYNLREKGIEARHAFKVLHKQTEYERCRYVSLAGKPVEGEQNMSYMSCSPKMSCEIIYLPLTPDLTHNRVVETFKVISSLA